MNSIKSIYSAIQQDRLPQALLFVGPLHCHLSAYPVQIMQLLCCKSSLDAPCTQCPECQMIERMEHPDMQWVKPEKIGGPIKIDQIRELQNSAYLTPQRANYKLIVIESADKMNTASANALLKILEEPPKHLLFILIAQQLSTVIPTILSRCQVHSFSASNASNKDYEDNLFLLSEHYPDESERALLIQQAPHILEGLIAILEQKEHPCILASQWSQYELDNLLWFLYLVYAQLQKMFIRPLSSMQQLTYLASLMNPVMIFKQIDIINHLLKKLSRNMSVNQTMALEHLLYALIR